MKERESAPRSLVRPPELWRQHHGVAASEGTAKMESRGQPEDAPQVTTRRLALVPPAGVEGLADRLLLGIGCGRLGDLLQRVERHRLSTECGRRGRVDRQDREVLRLDYIGSKEDGPANDVPELPHVPRPAVAQKDLSRRF